MRAIQESKMYELDGPIQLLECQILKFLTESS